MLEESLSTLMGALQLCAKQRKISTSDDYGWPIASNSRPVGPEDRESRMKPICLG